MARSRSRRGTPLPFSSVQRSASSVVRSSPSPTTTASRKSASGSGWVAVGPPATTIGPPSPRSAERSGTPPRSSIMRMFEYVSSNWSEKPTTSKSRSGRALSSDTSGSPRARSSRSMATHGA